MKCPKCKKLTTLLTKRTMANGNKVIRNRQCPRCKNRFVTVEQFQSDIEVSRSEAIHQIVSVESERDNFSHQLDVYRELFRGLGKAVKGAGIEKNSKM